MRIRKESIKNIVFQRKDYTRDLKKSIERIGFSFPIKVERKGNQIICVDGHKRLSALEDILIDHPDYQRGEDVYVVFTNNGDLRTEDCSRGRNTH